jgi:hypothetical protein
VAGVRGFVVWIVNGPITTGSVRDFVAVCCWLLESCTRTVNVPEPGAVGVPLISPVEVFKVRPVGKEPLVIAHVNGAVPPVAASVFE